jgi:lysophospholipase L1-like esterase
MQRIVLVAVALIVVLVAVILVISRPEVANPEPTGETIVCFGDSLTAGTGAPAEMAYPSQLSRMIGRPVINAGKPGDTTGSALTRLERDVLAHSPRLVLITLGGNDLMRSIPVAEAMANLEQIIIAIHDRGALVILGGIEPPMIDRGYGAGYQDLAERTRCVLIEDLLDDIMGNHKLMSDQIHPNGDGYTIVAQRFHAAIEKYLR